MSRAKARVDGRLGEGAPCTLKRRLEPDVVNVSQAGGTTCGPLNGGRAG